MFTLQAVRVVATLGIPDLIASGVRTAPDLASKLDVDADSLNRVLRHLTTERVFAALPDGSYALTPIGELLESDRAGSRRVKFMLNTSGPRVEAATAHMMHSIKTGQSAYVELFGESLWDLLAADGDSATAVDLDMASNAWRLGPELAATYDWAGVRKIVDVGGGSGEILANILQVAPAATGSVLEYASAAERARETFAGAGISDRANAVEGSFFDPLPAGADVYLLSWIIHDWRDADAVQILQRCREACGPKGRVLIVERMADDKFDRWTTHLDLEMLVLFGSRERTFSEYEDLARQAGLRVVRHDLLSSKFAVLECRI